MSMPTDLEMDLDEALQCCALLKIQIQLLKMRLARSDRALHVAGTHRLLSLKNRLCKWESQVALLRLKVGRQRDSQRKGVRQPSQASRAR